MADKIDFLLELFKTLKQASDSTESTLREMIGQQEKLVGHVEHIPVQDIKDDLKEHDTKVDKKGDKILKEVEDVKGKVGKMITVVLVAFSLLTISFIVGRLSMDTTGVKKQIQTEQHEEHQQLIDTITESMSKEFESIRDEIKRLHPSDTEEQEEE